MLTNRWWLGVFVSVVCEVLAGCSEVIGDSSHEPALLIPTWTQPVTVGAGLLVTPPPGVQLVDQKRRPVKGRLVEFMITKGGGVLEGASVRTDAQGMAMLRQWRAGSKPGETVVVAMSEAVAGVQFNADITAGPLASLRIIAGNGQQDSTNALLVDSLRVTTSDAYGNPIGGVVLSATPDSGSGTVSATVVVTNPWGEAALAWRVGPKSGIHRIAIRTQDAQPPLTAVATADVFWPPLNTPIRTGVGREHSCAVDIRYVLFCWGSNEFGQVGDGSGQDQPLGVSVFDAPATGNGGGTALVALGDYHTCATRSLGVWCWGRNDHGQLGDGTKADRATPKQVIFGRTASSLQAGRNLTCAKLSDGLYCWGQWRSNREWLYPRRLTAKLEVYVRVVVADDAVCIGDYNMLFTYCYDGTSVTDGTDLGSGDLWRLLRNSAGDLGGGVAGAGDHFCAGFAESVCCWGGSNKFGQLGNGSTTPPGSRDELQRVPLPRNGMSRGLFVGAESSCAFDGSLTCWGSNRFGVLGEGFTPDSVYPSPTVGYEISSGYGFSRLISFQLSIGTEHACAMTGGDDLAVRCWGNGTRGQLGNDRTLARDGFTASHSPVIVRHR